MNKISSVATILSMFPYFHKDEKGNKTDNLKGYGVKLLEFKYLTDGTPSFSDFTVFLNKENAGANFMNVYKPMDAVIVEFDMASVTSKPFFTGLRKLNEESDGVKETDLKLYFKV